MDKAINVYLPKWASVLYGVLAIILVPWIITLAEYLPNRHLATHWDTLWVGFDAMILITMLVTVYFMVQKTVWVIVSGTALATLFIVDAWFDILTARPGREQQEAILFGVVELSLAILTYRLVFHVIHHSAPEKNLRMIIKKKNS